MTFSLATCLFAMGCLGFFCSKFWDTARDACTTPVKLQNLLPIAQKHKCVCMTLPPSEQIG